MYRNFGVCPHCVANGSPGTVWKLNERTPSITLSDGKTFHLVLFSGPDAVPAPSGGILANRLVAQFSYVHDQLGSGAHWAAVLLTKPGNSFDGVKNQLEFVANKFTELLQGGKPLCAEYGFDGHQIWELKVYEKKLQPLWPVAVKALQTEVHAPDHDIWGIVTCDSCGEQFHLGPNRMFGAKITAEECSKQLQTLLTADHESGRLHANAYELPD